MGQTRGSGNAKGGKSLNSGKGRPTKQIISMTKHVSKPVFYLGDYVNGNSLSDDGATSHGPADCRVYGVKAYKLVGQNPSHPTVHIDPKTISHIRSLYISAADVDRLTRVFILCLIGSTLCAGRTNTVNLYYLPCLKNINEIGAFSWGGVELSCLYRNIDSLSQAKSGSIGGYWRAWELWACEYLMPLALFRPLHGPDIWPRRTPDTSKVPVYVKNSIATTQRRVLLQGPAGYAWYLGERVSIQSLGTLQQRVPILPPKTMLPYYRLDKTDIHDGLQGWEASTCFMNKDSDYATYKREYLVYRH
ncbi:hypothetical protein M0R45_016160 [Rubus argutus]|uniref:Aminotransferase-like plant mobile domain-containing protein n=1 Tax=Rubus argutus TaxID=59490 RepID=A0AAW1XUA1_RUBAR